MDDCLFYQFLNKFSELLLRKINFLDIFEYSWFFFKISVVEKTFGWECTYLIHISFWCRILLYLDVCYLDQIDEFSIFFRGKISHYSRKVSRWFNEQLRSYNLEIINISWEKSGMNFARKEKLIILWTIFFQLVNNYSSIPFFHTVDVFQIFISSEGVQNSQ